MIKSLEGTGNAATKKIDATTPEVEQYAEDNSEADIISHMLSVGAANEKPQSQNINYKLSMEVCYSIHGLIGLFIMPILTISLGTRCASCNLLLGRLWNDLYSAELLNV
jgi:hypothetical protein